LEDLEITQEELRFIEEVPWERNLLNAVKFLLKSQYNKPTLKLCGEGTMGAAANTYWLLSDNLLAAEAFKAFRLLNIANSISRELSRRGWTRNNFHEIILGKNIDFPPRTGRNIEIEVGPNYRILVEQHDGPRFSDFDQYADLSVYAILHYLKSGQRDLAKNMFRNILAMWDGIGLNDKVTKEKAYIQHINLVCYYTHLGY